MYAHVTGGQVDAITAAPPQTVFLGGRWYDLRTLDPGTLALAGWYLVSEATRPADTATGTWQATYTPNGGLVVQSWVSLPKTAEQLAAEAADANRQSIESSLSSELDELQTEILGKVNSTLTSDFQANPAKYLKILARVMRHVIRLLIRRLDGTS